MVQKLKNKWHFVKAMYWNMKCGWPGRKLYVIGVTGTDGKTTTCTLIYEMLKAAGYQVGLFSTVGVKYTTKILNSKFEDPNKLQITNSNNQTKIREIEIEKGLHSTNPGPEVLQPLLKKMADEGVTHAVLEVTSHGLDQNRVWGIPFKIGVLTNISHEHLDYHQNMQNYMRAKAKLMTNIQYSILNRDDKSFEYIKKQIEKSKNRKQKVKIIEYSKTKIKQISPALLGEYNKYNIGAAEAVCKALGIRQQAIEKVVKEFKGVPGRREEVNAGQPFRVIVDFAHTPKALEEVLKSLRVELEQKYHPPNPPLNLSGGRKLKPKLIVVFGCTGERDKEKRPMMGVIATKLADIVIVTSDDTRSENQDDIYNQIVAKIEIGDRDRVIKENDRKKAIEMAIKMAKPGDIVLLAGKGHEKSILLGKTEYPWSDKEVAKEMIVKG